ncbi:hypothetical protein ZTR_06992 [Talaromyces verruculosus]|nr:hypothetical protein ZTR_06992 [Talaromyces verruculosus]
MPIRESFGTATSNTRVAREEEIPALSRCANPDGISWQAVWYHPVSAPPFLICSYCYDHHINSTSHAGLFEATWEDGNFARLCQWNTPRVMSYLAANDWDAIKAFMIERVEVPACKGLVSHNSPDGSRWYSLTGAWEIQGFAICEACYRDLVIWNHLRRYFTTTPTIKSDEELWTCSAAAPFIKEGLCQAITSPDRWGDLHLLFRRRTEYPSCLEMKNLHASSTHWYSSKNVPDLIVCTACYLDHFVLDHARHWDLLPLPPAQRQQQLECAMHTFQIRYAWLTCKRAGVVSNTDEYDGFEQLARIILTSPPCSTEDMRDASWYAPENYHGNEFAICKRCLVGFMIGAGFASRFKEVDFPPGCNRICNLNRAAPLFLRYLAQYEVAVNQNNFSIFSNFCSEYAGLPDCPRNEPYKNRRWYWKGGFTTCEVCYKEAIQGTSLADQLDYGVIPNEARCQMYSIRMRSLWHQTCESNDLASFLALAEQRMNIYLFMYMEQQKIEFGQLQRMQRRHALLLASTINQGTDSIAYAAVGSNGGTMYGDMSMGFNWHSEAGFQAHQQLQQAMGINVVQAGDATALMPLIQMWAELE